MWLWVVGGWVVWMGCKEGGVVRGVVRGEVRGCVGLDGLDGVG